MGLLLQTARIKSDRQPGEGLRLGVVRYPSRGVKTSDYARLNYFDERLSVLAPSRELRAAWNSGDLQVDEFFLHYRQEMQKIEPRQVIAVVARVAKQTPLSICCYCEDERRCHRSVLYELIQKAAVS